MDDVRTIKQRGERLNTQTIISNGETKNKIKKFDFLKFVHSKENVSDQPYTVNQTLKP